MPSYAEDELRELLRAQGWYQEERPLENGLHFILVDGIPIDWYRTTGRAVVRDRATELCQNAQNLLSEEAKGGYRRIPQEPVDQARGQTAPRSTRVFIVYGHDPTARDELELISDNSALNRSFFRISQGQAISSSKS